MLLCIVQKYSLLISNFVGTNDAIDVSAILIYMYVVNVLFVLYILFVYTFIDYEMKCFRYLMLLFCLSGTIL